MGRPPSTCTLISIAAGTFLVLAISECSSSRKFLNSAPSFPKWLQDFREDESMNLLWDGRRNSQNKQVASLKPALVTHIITKKSTKYKDTKMPDKIVHGNCSSRFQGPALAAESCCGRRGISTATRTESLLTNEVLLLREVIAFVCRNGAKSSLSRAHLERDLCSLCHLVIIS